MSKSVESSKSGPKPVMVLHPPLHPHCGCSLISILIGDDQPEWGQALDLRPEGGGVEPEPQPKPKPEPQPKPKPVKPVDPVEAGRQAIERAMAAQQAANLEAAKGLPAGPVPRLTPFEQERVDSARQQIRDKEETIRLLLAQGVDPKDSRITSAQYWIGMYQDGINKNLAKATPTVGYAEAMKSFPNLLPPGPIRDRLAAYTAGDAKVREIIATAGRFDEIRAKLDAERRDTSNAVFAASDAYNAYLWKQTPKSLKKPEVQTELARLTATTDAARQARDAARNRIDGLAAEQQAEIARLIAPDKTMGYRASEITPLDAKTRQSVADASQWLGQITAPGDSATLKTEYENRVFTGNDRDHHSAGTITLSHNQEPWVVIHELGHNIEYAAATNGQAPDRISIEYKASRVGAEPLQQLNKVLQNANYKDDERGAKDKFDSAFTIDEAFYIGKDYGGHASEILSMGIQKLYQEPANFARNDPDYLRYVLGMLDGSLR